MRSIYGGNALLSAPSRPNCDTHVLIIRRAHTSLPLTPWTRMKHGKALLHWQVVDKSNLPTQRDIFCLPVVNMVSTKDSSVPCKLRIDRKYISVIPSLFQKLARNILTLHYINLENLGQGRIIEKRERLMLFDCDYQPS